VTGGLSSSSIMGSSGVTGANESLFGGGDGGNQQNHDLDDLWQSIRNFFDDLTLKGDKREIAKGDRPNKLKFMEACQSFDFTDGGVISEGNLLTAFSRSRYRPLPSQEHLSTLVKGLEAHVSSNGSLGGDVNYRKVMEAPVSREFISLNGIFPKIVSNAAPLINLS